MERRGVSPAGGAQGVGGFCPSSPTIFLRYECLPPPFFRSGSIVIFYGYLESAFKVLPPMTIGVWVGPGEGDRACLHRQSWYPH